MALTFYTGDFLIIYTAVSILLSILLTINLPRGLWQMLSSLRASPQCVLFFFFFPQKVCSCNHNFVMTVLSDDPSAVCSWSVAGPVAEAVCEMSAPTAWWCYPQVPFCTWGTASAFGRKAKLHPHLDRERTEDGDYEDRLAEEAKLASEADAGLREDEEWCFVTRIIWWLVLFVTRAGCCTKMSFWWKFDPFVILRG